MLFGPIMVKEWPLQTANHIGCEEICELLRIDHTNVIFAIVQQFQTVQ